jgi:predicted short-subunit dehydrogenase-like oxidoreductase (DUF2520 family)
MQSDLPRFPCGFALAAAGNVGLAVARLLREAGNEPVAVWSRSQGSADRASKVLDVPISPLEEVAAGADVLLIGATDSAIEEIARSARTALRPGSVVVHFAGASGTGFLASVADSGAVAAALHPVQACPDVPTAMKRLPGSAWGVTTDPEARRWAHSFVSTQLDGVPFDVTEAHRPAWHAAASITANGVAALLASSERMLAAIGVADTGSVLGPLAAGAVMNAVEEHGGAATLTGPVVRGETGTVRVHLEALEQLDGSLADEYRRVASLVLAVARQTRRLDDEDAAAIERLVHQR